MTPTGQPNQFVINGEVKYPYKARLATIRSKKYFLKKTEEKEKIKLLRRLIFICCVFFDIWPSDFIKGPNTRYFSDARKIYFLVAKRFSKAPESLIGQILNERDHSTVNTASKECEKLMSLPGMIDYKINYQIIEYKFKTSYEINRKI